MPTLEASAVTVKGFPKSGHASTGADRNRVVNATALKALHDHACLIPNYLDILHNLFGQLSEIGVHGSIALGARS